MCTVYKISYRRINIICTIEYPKYNMRRKINCLCTGEYPWQAALLKKEEYDNVYVQESIPDKLLYLRRKNMIMFMYRRVSLASCSIEEGRI